MNHQIPPNYTSLNPLNKEEIAAILTDSSLVVGIDKIRLSMPYFERKGAEDMWREFRQDLLGNSSWGCTTESVNGSLVYIRFQESSSRLATLEFNPTQILHKGTKLATWQETQGIFRDVLFQTFAYFNAPVDPRNFAITRLDLAVDLAPVADIHSVLKDLATHEAVRASKPLVYPDRVTGRYQTVIHRAESLVQVVAYDKSAQQKTNDQRLRIEVRLKTRELEKFGLREIDASEEDRARAFRARLLPLLSRWTGSSDQGLTAILGNPEETRMLIKASGIEYLSSMDCHPTLTNNFRKELRAFKKRNRIGHVKDLFSPGK